jgi:hypothetical protein
MAIVLTLKKSDLKRLGVVTPSSVGQGFQPCISAIITDEPRLKVWHFKTWGKTPSMPETPASAPLMNQAEPDANRVDGWQSDDCQCASHTTVRTGLVYGGSLLISTEALFTCRTFAHFAAG